MVLILWIVWILIKPYTCFIVQFWFSVVLCSQICARKPRVNTSNFEIYSAYLKRVSIFIFTIRKTPMSWFSLDSNVCKLNLWFMVGSRPSWSDAVVWVGFSANLFLIKLYTGEHNGSEEHKVIHRCSILNCSQSVPDCCITLWNVQNVLLVDYGPWPLDGETPCIFFQNSE